MSGFPSRNAYFTQGLTCLKPACWTNPFPEMVSSQGIYISYLVFNIYYYLHFVWSLIISMSVSFRQSAHQAKTLSSDQLKFVASLSNMQGFDVTLDPILVPRVVGTPNHSKVKQYIIDQMQSLGWNVQTDKFTDNTPLGKKNFENIISTLDPKADRNLVLACHYDS